MKKKIAILLIGALLSVIMLTACGETTTAKLVPAIPINTFVEE